MENPRRPQIDRVRETLRERDEQLAGPQEDEDMDEKKPRDDDAPESAEPPEAERLSEKVPDEVSGEGDTPLGGSDEHSDAPGETGTGSREGDPERGKPYRQ